MEFINHTHTHFTSWQFMCLKYYLSCLIHGTNETKICRSLNFYKNNLPPTPCLVVGKRTQGKGRLSNLNLYHSWINKATACLITVSQWHHILIYRVGHIISKCLKPGISVCDLSNTKRWNVNIKMVLIFYVKIILKKLQTENYFFGYYL